MDCSSSPCCLLIAALGRGIMAMTSGMADKGENVNIAYVQWDSEVASTNVIAEVLKKKVTM